MNIQEQNLIRDITVACIESGISLRLENTERIKCDCISCEGYFSDACKELIVGTKTDTQTFILTIAHEFSHMNQWKENSKIFKEADKNIPLFDRYIIGKVKRSKRTDKAISLIQKMELDCEIRTIQLIKDYQIPYDIKKCIKKSNAYIFFYSYLKVNPHWYKRSPGLISAILKEMPDQFSDNLDISDKLSDLYLKSCY
jgi:hypothetical protein